MQIAKFRFTDARAVQGWRFMKPVKKEKAVDKRVCRVVVFCQRRMVGRRRLRSWQPECWKKSGLSPSQGNLLLHFESLTPFHLPCYISSDLRVKSELTVTRLADQLEAKRFGLSDAKRSIGTISR